MTAEATRRDVSALSDGLGPLPPPDAGAVVLPVDGILGTRAVWSCYSANAMRSHAAAAVAAEREHVRIPTNAAEAKAMATVAIAWLREHAPDELRPEFRA